MAKQQIILVIGGTGAMGRAVVKALLDDEDKNWHVAVFTRSKTSDTAKKIVSQGGGRVSLREGNLDDEESLHQAMKGVYGVFCNTNFWATASVTGERDQCLRALRLAEKFKVEHFVFSSLDSVVSISEGRLALPHYDAKASIEHEIDWKRSDEYMRQISDGWYTTHVSVLVTCPYYENFQDFMVPEKRALSNGKEGLVFKLPFTGESPFQMVALRDIGYFASMLFHDRAKWGGKTLKIASEELPMKKVAEVFSKVTGIAAEFQPMSVEEFKAQGMPNSHDVANNFIAYREGFVAPRDYKYLRELNPGLMSFEKWLQETGWRGETREVRKEKITGEQH